MARDCLLTAIHKTSVFEIFDNILLKPACSVIENSQNIEILNGASLAIIPSRGQVTKALFRLLECAYWYLPLWLACNKIRFFATKPTIMSII